MLAVALLAACGEEPAADVPDAGEVTPDAPTQEEPTGVAPDDVRPGAMPLAGGDNAVEVPAGGEVTYRIESDPSEHVAFRLTFAPTSGVILAVDRWNGSEAVSIGQTDAGAGLRVLAVRDAAKRRTYWVRVKAGNAALSATLAVTRTPFHEANRCDDDCARLLQLPLPNDPAVDGYATDNSVVFRYWFGRRDLLMFLRVAGRLQAEAGREPFIPQDLSQWNGETPGNDVGAPRHASHQRGKDVDLSIYGSDGKAPWRSYCTITTASGGRQCVAGTVMNFDGEATAIQIASMFATGRVTMSFLDRELIKIVSPAAAAASEDGLIESSLVPLYGDGVHIQNWPNHDNHIHIRVSEEAPGVTSFAPPPFEAP